jgi:hypothetical protein
MTNKEKWNKIVELHNQLKYSREELIQKTWENIFSELFGYGKLFGEIDIQRSIQIGSTERAVADIIIKDKDKDLFIVEIKQHSYETGSRQLFSYLKLLHNDIGVLINNKITVFAYDYKKQDYEQINHEICFVKDSSDGESFVELFSKPFRAERVREFINQKNTSSKNVREIKSLINKKYIFELLNSQLSLTYSPIEIQEAFQGIDITINNKNIEIIPLPPREITYCNQNGVKIGQAVQKFFSKMSRENSLSQDLINKLCDVSYCKQKFCISRPVLKEVFDFNKIDDYRKDSHGHARYYSELYKYNTKSYILCSQWTTAQEPYFYQWANFFDAKIYN